MIVHSLKKGDIRALEQLYDMLHKRLYAFLFKIIRNQEVVEDIIQSTFIKVWDNRNKLSTEKPLDAQVYVIAKNLLLNYIKRQNIEKKVIEVLTHQNKGKEIQNQINYNETLNIYHNAIEKLPPKRKEIYKLRNLEGLSNKEIAQRLSISNNTVENQLSKANNFIRKNLYFLKESIAIIIIALFI